MKKILLSMLILSLNMSIVQAYEPQFDHRNSIGAGFRLNVPFGPTKKANDKVKYGFQLSFSRELSNQDTFLKRRQIFKADLVSLNFSENGFKALSLAGKDILIQQDGKLKMVNFKENAGRYYGGLAIGVILGGAAVAGGVVLIVTSTE